MIATYYAIREFNELSQQVGDIVDEGIIRDSEDTIYPGQNTGIIGLPQECEAQKFTATGYAIEITNFVLKRDEVKRNRLNGSKLTD